MMNSPLTWKAPVLVAILIYILFGGHHDRLPANLGNLMLREVVEGARAQEMVDRMHGKGVTPERTEIGICESTKGKANLNR